MESFELGYPMLTISLDSCFYQAGTNCTVCEESCSKPRPDGCSHPCLMPCHPGECPPCRQMIRMRCHCQLIVQHVECFKWTDASDREKTRLRSCPSRCPKTVSHFQKPFFRKNCVLPLAVFSTTFTDIFFSLRFSFSIAGSFPDVH